MHLEVIRRLLSVVVVLSARRSGTTVALGRRVGLGVGEGERTPHRVVHRDALRPIIPPRIPRGRLAEHRHEPLGHDVVGVGVLRGVVRRVRLGVPEHQRELDREGVAVPGDDGGVAGDAPDPSHARRRERAVVLDGRRAFRAALLLGLGFAVASGGEEVAELRFCWSRGAELGRGDGGVPLFEGETRLAQTEQRFGVVGREFQSLARILLGGAVVFERQRTRRAVRLERRLQESRPRVVRIVLRRGA
mmetsp:Transcript_20716/g.82681  ORF Transcript_20716/g.82681 Transcript_20716/m.82681 type:complete len:247 (+) Transcript_20716:483-1223(+)